MHKYIPLERFGLAQSSDQAPALYTPSGKPLMPSLDLAGHFGSVWDQSRFGACTAFAGLAEYVEWLVRCFGFKWTEMAEMAQYVEELDIEGQFGHDVGALGIDIIKVLSKFGAQLLKDFLYVQSNFYKQPDTSLFANPLPWECVRQLNQSNLLNDTLDALTNGLPVLFGFTAFNELESSQVAKTGILPMPANPNSPIGGHEVVAVGYNQATQMLKIRNSWSYAWGLGGYFWMPFEYYAKYMSDVAYVFVPPTQPYDLKPFPTSDPTPAPKRKPQPTQVYYELTVGPADEATVQQIERFCTGLHVGVVRKQVH